MVTILFLMGAVLVLASFWGKSAPVEQRQAIRVEVEQKKPQRRRHFD